jgi:YVTN family beta-propeller protein
VRRRPQDKKGPLVAAADLAEGAADCLAWSADDKLLAVGYETGAVAVFRVRLHPRGMGMRSALMLLATAGAAAAGDPPTTRLFVQDHAARAVRWADVFEKADGTVTVGPFADLPGFPTLDPAKQTLVQMRASRGNLLVGVRDGDGGTHGSGWVLAATGVKHSDHGDHSHWAFKKPPQVLDARIDADQGNPAHVYVYGDRFYVANDGKNGYTRLDPPDWYLTPSGKPVMGKPVFVPGGGGHITLAVVDGKVGYSCWIDGDGPNTGKVDVTPLTGAAPRIAYSFALPTGGIHGATTAGGKVFFAPSDGVCWVAADPEAKADPKAVAVKHVSLGKTGDKPNRTGVFCTHGAAVLCVTGRGAGARLAVLNAAAADPQPVFVPLAGKDGTRPVTPAVAAPGGKNPLAFVFHDREKDADDTVVDTLDVVALDPDGDGRFADATVVKSLPVGKSQVSGHAGHHDLAFDADGRLAFVTNPGDGTLTVLDVKALSVKATVKLGGMPTSIVAYGGRDHDD